MLEDVFKRYVKEICSTCKAKCDKGICVVYGKELIVQCVDYEKDETKIKEKEPMLPITANKRRPLMKGFI